MAALKLVKFRISHYQEWWEAWKGKYWLSQADQVNWRVHCEYWKKEKGPVWRHQTKYIKGCIAGMDLSPSISPSVGNMRIPKIAENISWINVNMGHYQTFRTHSYFYLLHPAKWSGMIRKSDRIHLLLYAGEGIWTPESLRNQILSLVPLTWLGNPRLYTDISCEFNLF